MGSRTVCAWCGNVFYLEVPSFVGVDFCSSDCEITYKLDHKKAQNRSKQPAPNTPPNASQRPKKAADEIFYAYEKENKASNDSSGIFWISIVTILIFIAIAATL